jgi:hypothetical protein
VKLIKEEGSLDIESKKLKADARRAFDYGEYPAERGLGILARTQPLGLGAVRNKRGRFHSFLGGLFERKRCS